MRQLMQTTITITLAGVLTAGPLALRADDAALILGVERYEVLDRLSRGADVVDAAAGLVALGFDVTALPNGRADTTIDALAAYLAAATEDGRRLIVLSGRFATDGTRTWFLTAEADAPGILSLGTKAVSVESLLAVLAGAQGRAVLVLGVEEDAQAGFDPWLREGIGALDVPQGVTVLTASPRIVADFLATDMLQPGGDLSALVADYGRIGVAGFLPSGFVFMPTEAPVIVEATDPEEVDPAVEATLWQGTAALDTVEAYRAYLRRYPLGQFATEAEEAITAIISEPNRDDRILEDTLALSRDQRRDIQRNLTLLDFNTRGIDGIFGEGSRSAITNWQQQNGFAQTGYVTAEQINRLDAQAARRAAQLEAEALRQQQVAAAADRAFWDETGARGDEAGLRAYVARYPDGLFAAAATEQLDVIEAANREQAAQDDRRAWDTAREADTAGAYALYLRAYAEGAFRAQAEAQIARLIRQGEGSAAADAARLTEQALGLTTETRQIVETRLSALDLEPGTVDGTFDGAARRAIRNYQRDRDLTVTGYLDEDALVLLLADGPVE